MTPDQELGRPLRVVHVNSAAEAGGAEVVALGLHRACVAQGWRSRLVVGLPSLAVPEASDLKTIGAPSLGQRWRDGLQARSRALEDEHRLLARALRGLAAPRRLIESRLGVEHFGYPESWRLLEALPEGPPDVVHVHNLHGDYFDLRALAPLSRRVPVVLTMHDAWLTTGHCAHSFDCERWRTGCGRCPDLRIYPAVRRDATRFNWERKRRALEGARLHLATPSRWLLERARASLLASSIVDARVIPNGVDQGVFRPGSRVEARRELGLDPAARLLLFVGSTPRVNPFKDFSTLLAATRRLADQFPGLMLMAVGEDAPDEQTGAALVRSALVRDPRRVARFYQAADVYVHATRADTFPTAVLEAMACGSPIVASRTGGVPEQLQDGRTALLVPPGDPRAMASAIASLLDDPVTASRLGEAAAADAGGRFDARARHDDYLGWYRALAAAR